MGTECKSKMSTLFSRFVSGQILRGSNQRLLSTTKARPKLPDVQGDGSKINIVPSRWNWEIWKNNIHMHILAWFGPMGVFITYVNVTHGARQTGAHPRGVPAQGARVLPPPH